ncbi:hypothetical protein UFOVP673_22 [uncultured Caudovirales phage]|uniref:Uncharacterized protein n=1 Tax=uncultured Caudovirales phage TaxID=2100421 RepID=A0A6J5NA56_9CAUD|nr:hypothetical protein UFOVP673_22 [uncultured Caudovirales phage]
METDTTQQTADNALQQQAATTTDTTTTPIESAPSTNQRPDFIPEKFWDAQKGEAKLDQLAISYANLEKAFSSKSQAPKKPGADASPEDQAKYFADLRKFTGAPEKPEDYGLKAPDKLPEGVQWNAELAGKAASIAHKYSVPPEALQELINLNNENISGLVEKSQAMQQEQVDAMVAELNAEWKDNAKDNWQRANRGAIALGVDLEASGLGNNPHFIRAALRFDEMIGDDKGLVKSDSAATYREQMERLQKSDDYQGKNGPEKQQAALARLQGLFNASQK